jgi:hypothetical protein
MLFILMVTRRISNRHVSFRAIKQLKRDVGGEWESGRMGEWESGGMGEWENGREGEK